MRNFNLGSLSDWFPVGMGELRDLPVPDGGTRSCVIDCIASQYVNVWCVTEDGRYLVGAGDGQLLLKFVICEPAALLVEGDIDAHAFIRTHVQTQLIPESVDPSFTNIEPRPVGPSDEVKRMMQIVQLNNQRRDNALRAELDELRRRDRERDAQAQAMRDERAAEKSEKQAEKEAKRQAKAKALAEPDTAEAAEQESESDDDEKRK